MLCQMGGGDRIVWDIGLTYRAPGFETGRDPPLASLRPINDYCYENTGLQYSLWSWWYVAIFAIRLQGDALGSMVKQSRPLTRKPPPTKSFHIYLAIKDFPSDFAFHFR